MAWPGPPLSPNCCVQQWVLWSKLVLLDLTLAPTGKCLGLVEVTLQNPFQVVLLIQFCALVNTVTWLSLPLDLVFVYAIKCYGLVQPIPKSGCCMYQWMQLPNRKSPTDSYQAFSQTWLSYVATVAAETQPASSSPFLPTCILPGIVAWPIPTPDLAIALADGFFFSPGKGNSRVPIVLVPWPGTQVHWWVLQPGQAYHHSPTNVPWQVQYPGPGDLLCMLT